MNKTKKEQMKVFMGIKGERVCFSRKEFYQALTQAERRGREEDIQTLWRNREDVATVKKALKKYVE